MAKARQGDAWNHTSSLLCLTHNVNCQEKKHQKQPWEFHPTAKKPKPVKGSIADLMVILPPEKRKEAREKWRNRKRKEK